MDSPAEQARKLAGDNSLSLAARRSRINQLAETERSKLGTERAPAIECYLEQLGRIESASGVQPGPEAAPQGSLEGQGTPS